ncbi:hypothetical protein DFH08DRAFT_1085981 [Mycena albidolilacea]|uniref:Uncharacterized protein n=1 Tax=Mycena albidolilacea TaxID=1033008 RepID=A0AAD7EFJ1_9AGAR|nr:hypothetical protein DFH08DRAFT_1085981 [Mycena albidolilacea]
MVLFGTSLQWTWTCRTELFPFAPFIHSPFTLPRLSSYSLAYAPALFCLTIIDPPSFLHRIPPSSLLSTDDPVFTFVLAPPFPLHHLPRASFVILVLVFHPFSPLPPFSSAHAHHLNPRRAVRLSRGPALHHLHPMRPLPLSPPRATATRIKRFPQHEHRDAAHEGAPET